MIVLMDKLLFHPLSKEVEGFLRPFRTFFEESTTSTPEEKVSGIHNASVPNISATSAAEVTSARSTLSVRSDTGILFWNKIG